MLKRNSIRYYDGEAFHNQQDESNSRYETTWTYEKSLYTQINNGTSPYDIYRIVPDETGKPVVIELEVDLAKIYRRKRNKRCFPIINRGNAWYRSLTEAQALELDKWYQDWLDVTETMVEPIKPDWLT